MSQDLGNRKYNALLDAAERAENAGEWRIAADTYLECVVKAPSKWAPNRWKALLGYSRVWEDHSSDLKECTSKEWKRLKRLCKDPEEPILFRAQALFLRGFLKMNSSTGEDEYAAIYFRQALFTIQKATPAECSRKVNVMTDVSLPVQDQLNGLVHRLENDLEVLEKTEYIDEGVLASVPLVRGRPDPAIVQRLVVGGSRCDCCGKSRTEVQDIFQWCGRCKRSYYCSEACQQRQWAAGHNRACREPGEIKPGDYMQLRGLKSRPELNGRVAKVMRQTAGRWAVSVKGETNTISVAPEKLVHIRPAK